MSAECTLCIRCRALDMLTGIRSSDQSDRHCIISSQSVSEVSVEFPNFLQFSLVRRPAARAQLCVACDPNYSRVTTTKPPTQSNTMPQYSYKFFCYPFSIFLFLPRLRYILNGILTSLRSRRGGQQQPGEDGGVRHAAAVRGRAQSRHSHHFSSCSP